MIASVLTWAAAHAENIACAVLLSGLALYVVEHPREVLRRLLEDWRDEVKAHADRWEALAPLAVDRVQAALVRLVGLLDRGARR
jgi:hypothetical protein